MASAPSTFDLLEPDDIANVTPVADEEDKLLLGAFTIFAIANAASTVFGASPGGCSNAPASILASPAFSVA